VKPVNWNKILFNTFYWYGSCPATRTWAPWFSYKNNRHKAGYFCSSL